MMVGYNYMNGVNLKYNYRKVLIFFSKYQMTRNSVKKKKQLDMSSKVVLKFRIYQIDVHYRCTDNIVL